MVYAGIRDILCFQISDKLLLSIFLELFGGVSDIHTFHLIRTCTG